jgi:hypothetical protein
LVLAWLLDLQDARGRREAEGQGDDDDDVVVEKAGQNQRRRTKGKRWASLAGGGSRQEELNLLVSTKGIAIGSLGGLVVDVSWGSAGGTFCWPQYFYCTVL